MKVRDVMSKDIIKVKPTDTIYTAIQKVFMHQVSGLIVVDENDSLIGTISEKTLYRAIYPSYEDYHTNPETVGFHLKLNEHKIIERSKDKKVENFMNTNVFTLKDDLALLLAGAKMLAREVNRVPVLDTENKLVGIISRRDIYHYVFNNTK